MSVGICWQCGKVLNNPVTGKPLVNPEKRTLKYTGQEVKLHKICAITFDEDQNGAVVPRQRAYTPRDDE